MYAKLCLSDCQPWERSRERERGRGCAGEGRYTLSLLTLNLPKQPQANNQKNAQLLSKNQVNSMRPISPPDPAILLGNDMPTMGEGGEARLGCQAANVGCLFLRVCLVVIAVPCILGVQHPWHRGADHQPSHQNPQRIQK